MNLRIAIFCALAAAGTLRAQEVGNLMDRINEKRMRALQAMNTDGKPDPELESPLVKKSYASSTFSTREFGTAEFSGTKSAESKTFATRSFLGIKNPWFGKKIFDTEDAAVGKKSAQEASEKYGTDSYAVRKFMDSTRQDIDIAEQEVPNSTRPRQYLGPEQPTKEKGIDQFTQNLDRDLTMEEVRDLLNKGQKAK